MKSIYLAALLIILGGNTIFAQVQASTENNSLARQTASAAPDIYRNPAAGTGDVHPKTSNAYMLNNLFSINYRKMERGKDQTLTMKNGAKSGFAHWNSDGTYTIYDNEMNVLGRVVYGKRGKRYQVWAEDGTVLKDSGSQVEKILTYTALVSIGIGVAFAAAGTY